MITKLSSISYHPVILNYHSVAFFDPPMHQDRAADHIDAVVSYSLQVQCSPSLAPQSCSICIVFYIIHVLMYACQFVLRYCPYKIYICMWVQVMLLVTKTTTILSVLIIILTYEKFPSNSLLITHKCKKSRDPLLKRWIHKSQNDCP